MKKNIAAFTIAEVLLTLVIIGIIASIVIPNTINDIQNAELHTAWKKAYSDFSQASKRLAIDNGGSLSNVFSDSNDARDKLSEYLNTVKKCDTNSDLGQNGCWHNYIFYLSGFYFDYWEIFYWSRMVLNNGMLVGLINVSGNCTYYRAAKQDGCVLIVIDVNGFKKPNTVGKDIFFSYLTKNGSFEAFGKPGDVWTTAQDGCDITKHSRVYGFTCATLYLAQ